MKEVNKKNITIFIHCFPPAIGGMEFLTGEIYKILSKDNNVHVMTGEGKTLDSYKSFSDYVTSNDKNIHRLKLNYFYQKITNFFLNKLIFKIPFFSPFYFGPILRYSKEEIDIIKKSSVILGMAMPTLSFISAYFFARKHNNKLILMPAYHNVNYYNNCYFFQKAFDYADKIICLSEKEKNDLTQSYKIDKKKIQIITYSPYTLKEINSQKKKLGKLIEQRINNFKNKKITLGYVGQITERKNLKVFKEFLDKYLAEFESRGYQLKILLAGAKTNSSPIIEKFLQKYIDRSIIKIIYNFINKQEIFKKIDIFINPSEEESLGIVNFEAIFYGLPILILQETAFSEFIEDRKNGLLFSNLEELYEKILYLLNNLNFYTALSKKQYKLLGKINFDKFKNDLIKNINCFF